ncbi:MAG: HlyD family efflux transporter periplasmic adaptor subunit, partial [Lachnospiraceae bacterium]|nr:HlyD family efflux transporter periplasmic adaptor subunit [Lachnospiraceae bacterium]
MESTQGEKKTRKEIIKNLLIIFLIIMLILTFFSNTIMNYSLPEVSTAYSSQGSVTSKVRGSAVVETAQDYEVNVTENHLIASVKVAVGDEIEEGDVLFELEAPSTTAGAQSTGTAGSTTADDDDPLKQAQETLDSLELEYNKALLEVSPSYGIDNLEIRSAQADLNEAIEAQKKSGSRAGLLEQQTNVKKTIERLGVEISELESEIETVSGNSLKKKNKKLIKLKQELEDANALDARIAAELEGLKSPEEAAKDVRDKQEALDRLLITLSDKKREDGSTSGKSRLDLAAQRKKIEDQKEVVEKLKNKANGGEDTEITAKTGGVIKQINCIAGDTVTADSPLAVIAVTGNGYSASFKVTKEQAKLVRQGQEADILNIWGDDISASLQTIKPDLEDPNNSKQLVFSITGSDVTVGQNLELSVGEKTAPYDVVVP